jgi:orotate phosphoribosyltransferase
LSTSDIRAIGGIVEYALCVVDREAGGVANLTEHSIQLRSLFMATDLHKSVLRDTAK